MHVLALLFCALARNASLDSIRNLFLESNSSTKVARTSVSTAPVAGYVSLQ